MEPIDLPSTLIWSARAANVYITVYFAETVTAGIACVLSLINLNKHASNFRVHVQQVSHIYRHVFWVLAHTELVVKETERVVVFWIFVVWEIAYVLCLINLNRHASKFLSIGAK